MTHRLRVGLLAPETGIMAMWTPAAHNCALLAAAEINAAGGVLGREIELFFADSGHSTACVAASVDELLGFERVDAIVGMHPSNLRATVKAKTLGKVPYIYTSPYEGGEDGADVFAIGETAAQLLRPAVTWLSENKKCERAYLIGSDYLWAWRFHQLATGMIDASGGIICGQEYVQFGTLDFSGHLERIKACKPDVVVVSLLGTDNANFMRAFADAGLHETIIRYSTTTDETMLYAIGEQSAKELYISSCFLTNSGGNDAAFVERYRTAFGMLAPIPNFYSVSTYHGMHFLAHLLKSMRSWSVRDFPQNWSGNVYNCDVRRSNSRTKVGSSRSVHIAFSSEKSFIRLASYP